MDGVYQEKRKFYRQVTWISFCLEPQYKYVTADEGNKTVKESSTDTNKEPADRFRTWKVVVEVGDIG
jgi:hypothetical protein